MPKAATVTILLFLHTGIIITTLIARHLFTPGLRVAHNRTTKGRECRARIRSFNLWTECQVDEPYDNTSIGHYVGISIAHGYTLWACIIPIDLSTGKKKFMKQYKLFIFNKHDIVDEYFVTGIRLASTQCVHILHSVWGGKKRICLDEYNTSL